MVIKLLQILFKTAIGNLPKEKKEELWEKFSGLLKEVTAAATAAALKEVLKNR